LRGYYEASKSKTIKKTIWIQPRIQTQEKSNKTFAFGEKQCTAKSETGFQKEASWRIPAGFSRPPQGLQPKEAEP